MSFAVALVEAGGVIRLMSGSDGVIEAFKTVKEGLDAFETPRRSGHARGYEASMSALIHAISFRPSIIQVEGTKDLEDLLGEPPWSVTGFGNVSGRMCGLEIKDQEKARKVFEGGNIPSLT